MNDIGRSTLFVLINLGLTVIVLGNTLLIVFHDSISTLLFIGIALWSGCASLVLMVASIKLGGVHEHSKRFVRSWKVKQDYSVRKKKVLLKLLKCCRLNRVEMGSTGCFKKLSVIRITGKIVFYTVKCLIILRPYSSDGRKLG